MDTGDTKDRSLFSPLVIGSMELRNRLAVAPMTRVSASADGHANARMCDYYSAFSEGEFGLVITEGIYTDKAFSQGYLHQPGLADTSQATAWKPVLRAVHAGGARMVAQLMHAGALSQGNIYRTGTRGPSSLQPKGQQMTFYRGIGPYPVPKEMSDAEIAEAVRGFAEAAGRAREAGFDGVEIHGANGYLLDQFLSAGINERSDHYGGEVEGRFRLIRDVAAAVRAAVGTDFTVGVRISQGKVNDFTYKWNGAEIEAARIFGALRQLPVDYVHTTDFEAWKGAFGTGPSLAALASKHTGLPVIANGSLHDPVRAQAFVDSGQADMVSLGRGALSHADWPHRVRVGQPLEEFDREILSPIADLANADQHRAKGLLPIR